MQHIVTCDVMNGALQEAVCALEVNRLLLVCASSFDYLPFSGYIRDMDAVAAIFSDFASNPSYESVIKGVRAFRVAKCDGVLAVGGGSAMDVGKCIKLFCTMEDGCDYLTQEKRDNGVPLFAIPTTAGTGSESTHFAVIYRGDEKLSIAHDSILPSYALLDASALKTLPTYQKKCAALDAFCQAIESFWSVNANAQSHALSKAALSMLLGYSDDYLAGDAAAARQVMCAANLAGQAINITKTTAAHAMSYSLTKRFLLPHGHAAAICLPGVWRYIGNHVNDTIDPRGAKYLRGVMDTLSALMGCDNAQSAASAFEQRLRQWQIAPPLIPRDMHDALAQSVNPERLGNTPVPMTIEVLRDLYAAL